MAIHNTSRHQIAQSLYIINSRMSWLHRFQGIDISRCFEYTEAYIKLSSFSGARILDIGSYRSPFPAFLLQQGYQVAILDIDPVITMQRKWIRRALRNEVTPLITQANGTRLPFSAGSFDKISCISTIEHLPKNQDMLMMREVSRVLRRGGHCFISVPYALTAAEGTWGKWFQRWYNVSSAAVRLVQASELQIIDQGFLMGGKVGTIADKWYAMPRMLRHGLSWTHILFFPFLFKRDVATSQDARVLWLLLRKA